MCLLLRRGFLLATIKASFYHSAWLPSTIKAWLVECYKDDWPSGRFSYLHRGTLLLCQSDHRVLGHLPDQGPTPQLLSLAGWPALGRILVVPNHFHFRMMEATVFLGPSMLQKCLVPFPRSVPRHNPVSEVYKQFLRPQRLVFFSDMHWQLWDLV